MRQFGVTQCEEGCHLFMVEQETDRLRLIGVVETTEFLQSNAPEWVTTSECESTLREALGETQYPKKVVIAVDDTLTDKIGTWSHKTHAMN